MDVYYALVLQTIAFLFPSYVLTCICSSSISTYSASFSCSYNYVYSHAASSQAGKFEVQSGAKLFPPIRCWQWQLQGEGLERQSKQQQKLTWVERAVLERAGYHDLKSATQYYLPKNLYSG